ncbi:hypothetical protein [Nonomuraea recticatena]|uniref:Uncharacterized protein n=1 Tax=Nonomuraea recticatena TaxID=46178 RepID=A0ABN3TGB3_9ACTN
MSRRPTPPPPSAEVWLSGSRRPRPWRLPIRIEAESATENVLVGTPVAMMDRARDVIRQAMGKAR